jgi:hypothetical protein
MLLNKFLALLPFVLAVAASPTSLVKRAISPDGTCGPANGYTCPAGQCCSQYNWCGVTADHCGMFVLSFLRVSFFLLGCLREILGYNQRLSPCLHDGDCWDHHLEIGLCSALTRALHSVSRLIPAFMHLHIA